MANTTCGSKIAPRFTGFGNDVAQLEPHVDWTPWTQLAPQLYSGRPRALTLPRGLLRAVRSVTFSGRDRRCKRSLTRARVERDELQKGKRWTEVASAHARGMVEGVWGEEGGRRSVDEGDLRHARRSRGFTLTFITHQQLQISEWHSSGSFGLRKGGKKSVVVI
uniref:Uncharacterized protein n=1 Tax=Hyaloperonospora arabidopsidis (strain Emoy2) TaxID=559515 RepID=M4C1I4_HYAAE